MDCKSISTYRNLEIQALNRHKEQKEVKELESYILREAFRHETFSAITLAESQKKQKDKVNSSEMKINYFA